MSGWSQGKTRSVDNNPVAGNAPTDNVDLDYKPRTGRIIAELMRGVTERKYNKGLSLDTYKRYDAKYPSGVNVAVEASGTGVNWAKLNSLDCSKPAQPIRDIQNSITDALAIAFGHASKAALLTTAIGNSSFTVVAGNQTILTKCIIELRKVIECLSAVSKETILTPRDNVIHGSGDYSSGGKSTKQETLDALYLAEESDLTYTKLLSQIWTYKNGCRIDYSKNYWDHKYYASMQEFPKTYYNENCVETSLASAISRPDGKPYARYIFDFYRGEFHHNWYPLTGGTQAFGGDFKYTLRWGTGFRGKSASALWHYEDTNLGEQYASPDSFNPSNKFLSHFPAFEFDNPFPDPVPSDIFIFPDFEYISNHFKEESLKTYPGGVGGGASILDINWMNEGDYGLQYIVMYPFELKVKCFQDSGFFKYGC